MRAERERGRGTGKGEKQAPCREPDAGLDPRTPGSHPEPKADVQPLSHPGISEKILKNSCTVYYAPSQKSILCFPSDYEFFLFIFLNYQFD